MLPVALLLLGAAALAVLAYGGMERLLPGAWLAAAGRAVAWVTLGILLLNPSCPAGDAASRPLVLLDGSLSMAAAGGRWEQAHREARSTGDVRLFGDPARTLDSLPVAGRSWLGPALEAAVASGRPVVVHTDGEIEDAAGMSPASLLGASVRVFPRRAGPAIAVRSVEGPRRATERDTLRFRIELVSADLGGPRELEVAAHVADTRLGHTRVAVPDRGVVVTEVTVPPGRLAAGDHILALGFAEPATGDPRDDRRLHHITMSATPGIVLVASPGDWEARTLYRVLRDVTDLPVEGFVELAPGRWRRMADLSDVEAGLVQRAVSRADLVVLRGSSARVGLAGTRAALIWPGGSRDELNEGDWYISIEAGPVAGALTGFPVESLPPAIALASLGVGEGEWTGLTAQAARRGAVRPVLTGGVRDGRRQVTIGAEGLWRWAFRGGTPEQAYRALIGSVVDWLLAAPDPTRGTIRPVQAVVAQGRPVVFAWIGPGEPSPLPLRLTEARSTERVDTLRFDGSGRASLFLPPGTWTWAPGHGPGGIVVVDHWSPEWFPGPVTLEEAAGVSVAAPGGRGARDVTWLFGLVVLALSFEWWLRRRRGLR